MRNFYPASRFWASMLFACGFENAQHENALPSHSMRVIAGLYRSRPLAAPKGLETRPTYDRLRETLFNVLAPRLAGAVFADLYAGSGANGIEALSRGSRFAYFVETAEPALDAIRANLTSLKIVGMYGLEPRTVSSFLRRSAANVLKTGQTLDIVFLDPSYEDMPEYSSTLRLLGGETARVLNENSIVIAEHQRRSPLAESYGSLKRYRVLEQRDSALSFYAPEVAETPAVAESLQVAESPSVEKS